MSDASLYPLLSCLWLHEPDSTALAEARRHEPFANALETDSDQTALASAYADLFLLNVYPYGTAYTDEWGELNTGEAQSAKAVYEAHGYNPPELNAVGAPDHVGLGLGFLAHLTLNPSPHEREGLKVRSDLLAWVPVCCLAVECQPFVHPFYRELAKLTRETLWTDGQGPPITDGQGMANGSLSSATGYSPDGELRLRDVVRFLLVPARCGVFLSRARLGQMAKTIGTRLPFGSRFEVAEWLFTSAGESGRVGLLLSELQSEVDEWLATYSAWAEAYPVWQSAAAPWLARAQAAHEMLQAMAVIALTPAPIEIGSAEEP